MPQLNVAIFQHSEKTPAGTTLDWLKRCGHAVSITKLFAGEEPPDLAKIDWLIILGGPMNVDDVDIHPWLTREKAYIARAVNENKLCLGLCLGGQLLSQTLGGRVAKNKHWEIGWKKIDFEGREITAFQFHQDCFTLPPGAQRLATNEITENQAFAYGRHVIGIQFHPESTDEWVRQLSQDPAHPGSGPYVDSGDEMIEGLHHLPKLTSWYHELLEKMEARALGPSQRRESSTSS